MAGYIKDYRKELESDIWLMPPLYHRVWQYLKYKVNHTETEIPQPDGSIFTIKRGQHLTTLREIAEGVSWMEGRVKKVPNPHTISKILSFMVKRNMIAIEETEKSVRGNRKYTLITLINWEKYQLDDVTGNTVRHSEVTVRAQNNNDKELINNTTTDQEFEKIFQAFLEIHGKLDIHVKPQDIKLMQGMISRGVPSDLIINVMRQVYQERTSQGTRITTFAYYKNAILDAWETQKAITDGVPIPEGVPLSPVALGPSASITDGVPVPAVALGRKPKPKEQIPSGPYIPGAEETRKQLEELEKVRLEKLKRMKQTAP